MGAGSEDDAGATRDLTTLYTRHGAQRAAYLADAKRSKPVRVLPGQLPLLPAVPADAPHDREHEQQPA